jgi:hypothetical protein
MGWPKKFAISCQPFNRSVQSSVLPLRITQITPRFLPKQISRLAAPTVQPLSANTPHDLDQEGTIPNHLTDDPRPRVSSVLSHE